MLANNLNVFWLIPVGAAVTFKACVFWKFTKDYYRR
jgi:hypothetical protein